MAETVPSLPAKPLRQPPSVVYLTLGEVEQNLRLSRSKVYDLIAHEGLPTRRFGRAVRVPLAELQDWLARRPADTSPAVAAPWTARRGPDRAGTRRR